MILLNVCLEVSHQMGASDQSKFTSQVKRFVDDYSCYLKLILLIYIVVYVSDI